MSYFYWNTLFLSEFLTNFSKSVITLITVNPDTSLPVSIPALATEDKPRVAAITSKEIIFFFIFSFPFTNTLNRDVQTSPADQLLQFAPVMSKILQIK
jgi:hypothetical protein